MSIAQRDQKGRFLKGGVKSPETRLRMRYARLGRVCSEETKQKIREALKGRRCFGRVPHYSTGWRYCSFCGEYISPADLPSLSYEAVNGSLRHSPTNRKCGQQLRSRPSNMKRVKDRGYYH